MESVSDRQTNALASFENEYLAFLRRAHAEWSSERDSDPISTDDAKFLLNRIESELVDHRSRITNDSGQLSRLLSDVTKQLKILQRHQVYIDGGVSFREFWQEGDEILFLLDIIPALLSDAQADAETVEKRASLIRGVTGEIEFNQKRLRAQEYSTPAVLQTSNAERLLAEGLRMPERLLSDLRTYVQNIQAAHSVLGTIVGTVGNTMPELTKIESLLKSAETAGDHARRDIELFSRYRYPDSSEIVR